MSADHSADINSARQECQPSNRYRRPRSVAVPIESEPTANNRSRSSRNRPTMARPRRKRVRGDARSGRDESGSNCRNDRSRVPYGYRSTRPCARTMRPSGRRLQLQDRRGHPSHLPCDLRHRLHDREPWRTRVPVQPRAQSGVCAFDPPLFGV